MCSCRGASARAPAETEPDLDASLIDLVAEVERLQAGAEALSRGTPSPKPGSKPSKSCQPQSPRTCARFHGPENCRQWVYTGGDQLVRPLALDGDQTQAGGCPQNFAGSGCSAASTCWCGSAECNEPLSLQEQQAVEGLSLRCAAWDWHCQCPATVRTCCNLRCMSSKSFQTSSSIRSSAAQETSHRCAHHKSWHVACTVLTSTHNHP